MKRKPFVGRRAEMKLLNDALREANAGRGKIFMLAGEPGVGKTRLAEELCRPAERLGMDVAWSACLQDAAGPLYAPWTTVILSLLGTRGATAIRRGLGAGSPAIAAVMPSLADALPKLPPLKPIDDPVSDRFRFSSSMSAFLSRASKKRPILIVMDDLHAADGPSLQLLAFLARDLATSRVLVLGTYRDVEVVRGHPLHQALGDLAREKSFERLRLRGLGRDDIGQYLAAVGAAEAPGALADEILSLTDGNAFLCTEVIRQLIEEGRLAAGAASYGTARNLGLPQNVRDVIGRRLGRLSRECDQVLLAAAAMGREFDLRVVGKSTEGLSAADLLAAMDEATASGLVEASPDSPHRYRFDHELTRQALIRDRAPGEMARLHARIAQTLEEAYGGRSRDHARELAEHFCRAEAVLGSEKLQRYLVIAGEQALASHAYEDARRCFSRALALRKESPPNERTADLLFGLGISQIALLDGEAAASLRKAFAIYEHGGRTEKAIGVAAYPISRTSLYPGAIELAELAPVCERAITMAGEGTTAYAELAARRAFCDGRLPIGERRRQLVQALRIARRASNAGLEIRILSYLVNVEAQALEFEAAGNHAKRAYELAVREGDLQAQCRVLNDACGLRSAGVSLGKGIDIAEEFREKAEKLRDQGWLHLAYFEAGRTAYGRMEWARAREMNGKCLSLLPPGVVNGYALMHRATIEYQTGRFDEGDRAIAEALDFARGLPPSDVRRPSVARYVAHLMLVSGRSARLDETERLASDALADPSTPAQGRFYGELARGYLAVIHGDAVDAAASYEALRPWRDSAVRPRAPFLPGLLARTAGRIDSAVRDLREANARGGSRLSIAWGLTFLAETLVERSRGMDRQEAERCLERVLSMASSTGSTLVEGRAAALLERARILPFAGAGRKRIRRLSDRQLEVLDLVAAGKTNKEIGALLSIGTATVNTHLRNILKKTGAANRAEASAQAIRSGLMHAERRRSGSGREPP